MSQIEERRDRLVQACTALPEVELVSCLPAGPTHATPLLFVHGAWHGAWCWERFLPYFAHHGYAAHALSFRGHGGSAGRAGLRWYRAARHYLADVEQVAAALPAPPILIGHSLGGYVVRKYLETHVAPAAVLLAPIPAFGTLAYTCRLMCKNPWECLKTMLQLDPRQLVATPRLARQAFFSADTPQTDVDRYAAQLQSESLVVIVETALLNIQRLSRISVPMLTLAAADDGVFTPREVAATARAYRADFACIPRVGHDMMLEPGWREVADTILCWLARYRDEG